MATEQFANVAQTTLDASLSAAATSLTVVSASLFPTAAQFRIRIDDELLLVTDGAGTATWTVTRATEGTTAVSHTKGNTVTHVLTKAAVLKLKAELWKAISVRG